ncbi:MULTISPECIES: DUF2252 family protein [Methylobacterium]|jgi:uncharacterized protein (DUF2252 family)|uniref:DUF2252 domain-containing protein n=2 Tax=Methylobacterium TaxID=407 RepID=A0A2R4WM42_9HYPH|nr:MULTISPECIES: DUF2252 family protein [Methylobacterium]MBZ6411032.1 DUF2252 domain-containing protein [Methylobacterium sp.]AWB22613.1 DUF2252 domain-containing protein [Methylobacterium currus]MBK3397176.1 DUF2252 family protein [Methylobacterium ajmalii]MBK3408390.1 DUF2252 family protein [Methylobacterium ajmalii]MBK3422587.1 DUF2252 family protein [Methylobacterium ajmalii]
MPKAGSHGPEERAAVLERQRRLKMARSAHAYVRGNTVRFYEWLDGLARGTLPEGPPVWICGDCHLGNLGPLADADGHVDIQVRDLDQTVVGNPTHDLVRLGLPLASAARGSDLPGVVTARMLEEMVRGYANGLAGPGGDGVPPEPDVVRTVRRQALGRRWKHLARERLKDVEPSIPLGRKFWALDETERDALGDLFEEEQVRGLLLALNGRGENADIRLIDAAYWMKGCSSLGFLRYAALVRIEDGGKRRLALVDLKEAVEPAAPAATGARMPADPAERVVTGARALSPNLGERMLPVSLIGKPVVMRELAPQDLKLDVDQFSREEAVRAAHYLAHVVGKAHGRQMDEATRAGWRDEVMRGTDGGEQAPSWLWSSVVELAGRHEVGYLQHCRRYATAEAA